MAEKILCKCGCGYPTGQVNGYVRDHYPQCRSAVPLTLTPEQLQLMAAANALLLTIEQTVPRSTAHWVVEQARRAARQLASYADTVQTRDYRKGA